MSRPSTEAQYLAGLVPPSVAATGIGRRSLLRGAQAGAGFVPAMLPVLVIFFALPRQFASGHTLGSTKG
jgi:ABC-type glycerol-3-phosphate transport system permease component